MYNEVNKNFTLVTFFIYDEEMCFSVLLPSALLLDYHDVIQVDDTSKILSWLCANGLPLYSTLN